MQKKLTRNVTKILLVDDDADVATTFKAILQDVGFIVDIYEDPLIALSDFKPRFYDSEHSGSISKINTGRFIQNHSKWMNCKKNKFRHLTCTYYMG